MTRRNCSLVAAVLIAGAVNYGTAQERPPMPVWAGPAVALGLGAPSAAVPVYAAGPDCGTFAAGQSMIVSAGGVLLLPELFAPQLGGEARLLFSTTSGTLHAAPADVQRVFDPATMQLVELQREFRLAASMQAIHVDLLGHYSINDHISLGVGPSFDLRIASTFSQTDNVTGPDNHAFADGTHEHTMTDGSALHANSVGIGALAYGGYDIPLNTKMTLRPELALRTEFLSEVNESAWRTASASVGASLLWDVTPVPPPPPPPVVVAIPHVPHLMASLHVHGIDTNHQPSTAAVVRVRDVIHRQQTALLPLVFFDSSSSVLPERYRRIAAGEASRFSPTSLAGLSVPEEYLQILNIIGSRLRAAPAATVTLMGEASSMDSVGLSLRRAVAVRAYLHDVWGIEEERMKVAHGFGTIARSSEASSDGRAENRRVEIVGSTPEITGMIAVETVERMFTPPVLLLAPRADAEAGVRKWSLTLWQRDRMMQEFSGDDAAPLGDREWRIDQHSLDSTAPGIAAVLTVEDGSGRSITVRDSVPLLFEHRRQIVDSRRTRNSGRERLEYSLLNFDYNSAAITGVNRDQLAEIASVLQEGAVITITGYTDRTGSGEYNSALSRQRADRVSQELRAAIDQRGTQNITITAEGDGVDERRFGNDLQEGRMLSRSVRLIIEQGVDPSDNP